MLTIDADVIIYKTIAQVSSKFLQFFNIAFFSFKTI